MTTPEKLEVVIVGDIALNQDITSFGQKISPGGGAYYSMVGAARFGEKIGVVAKIGTDFDSDLLRQRNVDTRGISQRNGDSCRFVLTQYPDNTRAFEAHRGVSASVEIDIFPEIYATAQYIHLATQLPEHILAWQEFLHGHTGVSVDTFESFIEQYPAETRLALDQAEIIFINEAEFKALDLHEDSYPDKILLLKCGKNGVVYRSPSERLEIPAPRVYAMETTGAGDVLAGAFLALLSLGNSTAEALTKAVSLASYSVSSFGVDHIPTKESMSKHSEYVAAALVINEKGEIFLGRSKKFDLAWIVPGGHIEEGENGSQAVLREVREELGVALTNPTFLKTHELYAPDYKNRGATFICENFTLLMNSAQTIRLNNEYEEYQFVSPEVALTLPDLHVSARLIIGYYLA